MGLCVKSITHMNGLKKVLPTLIILLNVAWIAESKNDYQRKKNHFLQDVTTEALIKTIGELPKPIIIVKASDEVEQFIYRQLWENEFATVSVSSPITGNNSAPLFIDPPIPHIAQSALVIVGGENFIIKSVNKLIVGHIPVLCGIAIVVPMSVSFNESKLPLLPLGINMLIIRTESKHSKRCCVVRVKRAFLNSNDSFKFRTTACFTVHGNSTSLRLKTKEAITLVPRYLKSFKGSTIRVAVVKDLMEVIPIRFSPRLVLVGWLGKMLTEWSRHLNFTINIVSVIGFGSMMPNGTFNGVIGTVNREEADIAAASLSITEPRMEAVHFLEWMTYQRTVFICHLPTVMSDEFLIFRVFNWKTYATYVCSIILIAAVLALMSPGRKSNMIFLTVKTFAYQGGTIHDSGGNPVRIVVASAWLLTMIIYYLFSGSLTAFLSIPRVVSPPNNVKEINERGYRASINQGYSQYDLLKDSPSREFQKMFSNAIIRRAEYTTTNGDFEALKRSKIVTIMGEAGAVFHISGTADKNKVTGIKECNLMIGKEYISIDYNSFAVKKNSFLKPSFDRVISHLRAMGILQNEFDKEFTVKCKYENIRSSEQTSLQICQLTGLFYVWLVGVVISIVALLCEIGISRYSKKQM